MFICKFIQAQNHSKIVQKKKNNKNNKEIFGRVRSLEHFSAFLTETQIVILKLKQKPFGTHLLVTTNVVTKQFFQTKCEIISKKVYIWFYK